MSIVPRRFRFLLQFLASRSRKFNVVFSKKLNRHGTALRRVFVIIVGWTVLVGVARGNAPGVVEQFIGTHCLDCHSGEVAEADLQLDDLKFDLSDRESFNRWVSVHDRLKNGEMPPPDFGPVDRQGRTAALTTLESRLREADKERQQQYGRGVIRRLNRAEFETVLSDLLEMPFHIQNELPEDAKSHGFDTVGAALNVSSVQMEAYLTVLDHVLDRATSLHEMPQRRQHRLTYRENNGIMQVYRRTGPFLVQDDGVAFFATEKFSHLNAVLGQWTAPYTGRYRVKVSAYAVRSKEPVIVSLRAGGNGHAESNHVPHVFLDHFSLCEGEPQVFEWEGWLERGHYFHVYPTSLRPMRFAGKQEEMRQPEYSGPGAVVQWVEVDGPLFESWPPPAHRALWDDVAIKPIVDAEPNKDPIEHLDRPPSRVAKPRMTRVAVDKETGNKWKYNPHQEQGGEPLHRNAPVPKPLHPTFALAPKHPKQRSIELLERFATRAWRRPISQQEMAPFVSLVHRWLDQGRDFEAAMRVGYKALLTAPGFLYHQGTLPDAKSYLGPHALSERLAFFLWNGAPDQQLREFADSIAVSDGHPPPAGGVAAEALRKQVERMLSDPRSNRFVDAFLGLWLDLRLIDFTVPDEKLYPEFDQLLQWSMVQETHGFFRYLIDEDLPVRNLIDSDFAMLNWRLAKHYDLPSVDGMKVRRVSLPQHSVRGGLITQASVLKVTANGTSTSPVVRGIWLLDRIMGSAPDPPPPGVPAIEPDIRGATTIREQLALHRSAESCASCHAKIDPPGVALENFDVIGGWRDHYRAINEDLADVVPKYSSLGPPPIRYVQALPVDASYKLADGRSFRDIEGFKSILLADARPIARGVTEKLVVYATGAELSFADRVEIERILDRAEPSDYGMKTLIQEVICSPLFQAK